MSSLRPLALLLAACASAAMIAATQADDCRHSFKTWHLWQRCVGCTTCDDYCPKPQPCANHACGFTCLDYCPKCPPRTHLHNRFGCDDYCPKPQPKLPCPWTNFLLLRNCP